jgi:hypothetical protein
MRVH